MGAAPSSQNPSADDLAAAIDVDTEAGRADLHLF